MSGQKQMEPIVGYGSLILAYVSESDRQFSGDTILHMYVISNKEVLVESKKVISNSIDPKDYGVYLDEFEKQSSQLLKDKLDAAKAAKTRPEGYTELDDALESLLD